MKKASKYGTHITAPDGTRVYIHGKTKAERDRKVAEAKQQLKLGVNISDETLFTDYTRLWLKIYKCPKLRDSSYQLLEMLNRTHVEPFFAGMRLRDIKPMTIQLFLASLDGLSQSTQRKCLGIVRNVLQVAVDNGLLVKTPVRSCDKASGEKAKEEIPLTNEQARRLLDAVEGTSAYPFILIALTTGLRRGEILGLMWEDIDFEKALITVTHNKPLNASGGDSPVTTLLKTEAAHRALPIPGVLEAFLLAEREKTSSAFVIHTEDGRSLTRNAFRAMWRNVQRRTVGKGEVPRKLGQRYGNVTVMLDFDVHPHLLRHTYLTQLFEAGLDVKQVQYLAGHSSPTVTMSIYTHYRQSQRSEQTAAQVRAAMSYLS